MNPLLKLTNLAVDATVRAGAKSAAKKGAPALPDAAFDAILSPKADRFTAGFGKAAVLPEDIDTAKYYIAGYRENNPARGVIDPQYVSALWLDDGSGRGGVLFLAVDAVGILRRDVQALYGRLAGFKTRTGCRKIMLSCTHDHAGIDTMGLWGPLPRTGKNRKFMDLLFTQAEKAAEAAYEDRRPGELRCGRAEVPDLQEDIRTPEVYSRWLTRLRFVPEDGSREIWLLNFAAHCESLQGCNSLVSADYPCYLRERIREETGAETLFTVGAVGGMISMKVEDENLLRKERRLLESTRRIGRRLADYALGISEERTLAPRLNYITQLFYVPVENRLLTIAGMVGIISVDRYMLPDGRAAILTELTYMEIGDLNLLFLPGELFPELVYGGALGAEASATGLGPEANPPTLCDIAGDKDLLVFGLAGDEIGYVIPPNDFYLHPEKAYLDKGIDRLGRRHYEETNSAGPGAAAAIAAALEKAIAAVRKFYGGNPPAPEAQ